MIESTAHKPSDEERRETAIRKCEAEIERLREMLEVLKSER